MLAQAAALRRFVAEDRVVHVIHLHGQRPGIQAVLDERAHRAGGAFGLEGDGAVAFVCEGVHFLLHNVRRIAHAAKEKLGVLEHGRADFAIARAFGNALFNGLDGLEAVRVLRKQVLGPFGGLCQHSQFPPACGA